MRVCASSDSPEEVPHVSFPLAHVNQQQQQQQHYQHMRTRETKYIKQPELEVKVEINRFLVVSLELSFAFLSYLGLDCQSEAHAAVRVVATKHSVSPL